MFRKLFVAVPLVALALGGSTACATKKFVRTSVGEVNEKVDAQGRSLEDILDDPYLKNRATDEQRLRLLERPEVIRAVGEDTAAMAVERVRDVS